MAIPAKKKTARTPAHRVETLEAMLMLVSHDQPFQPFLAATTDMSKWAAYFAEECYQITKHYRTKTHNRKCPQSLLCLTDLAGELYAASHIRHFPRNVHAADEDLTDYIPSSLFGEIHLEGYKGLYEKLQKDKTIAQQARRMETAEHRLARASQDLIHTLCKKQKNATTPILDVLPEPETKAQQDTKVTLHSDKKGLLESLQRISERSPHSSALPPPRPIWNFSYCDEESDNPSRDSRASDEEVERMLWRTQDYLAIFLLPKCLELAKIICPGKDHKHRGYQQTISNSLLTKSRAWLQSYVEREGWRTIYNNCVDVSAISKLLNSCQESGPFQKIAPETPVEYRDAVFRAFASLPADILQATKSHSWQESFTRYPDRFRLVCEVLALHRRGFDSVTASTFPEEKAAALLGETTNDSQSKKFTRIMHSLAEIGLAYHGVKSWVSWKKDDSASLTSDKRTKRHQGWLINPLALTIHDVKEAVDAL